MVIDPSINNTPPDTQHKIRTRKPLKNGMKAVKKTMMTLLMRMKIARKLRELKERKSRNKRM